MPDPVADPTPLQTPVYLWLENASFREELSRQREQLTVIALEGLGASVVKAIAVLVGLLESPKDHVRLKAAETIVRLERKLSASDGADENDTPVQQHGSKADSGLRHLLSLHQLAEMRKIDGTRHAAKPQAHTK